MLLNGRPYAYKDIQDNERIPLNTIQLMEISHEHGGGHGMGMGGGMMGGMRHGGMGGGMGGMMAMAHPIHLHGQPFQIVSRSIDSTHEERLCHGQPGFHQ